MLTLSLGRMCIERFVWTDHAELRLDQRSLLRFEIEEAVRRAHKIREQNRGDADWRIYGVRPDGRRFTVIYDSPVRGDASTARIVSAWPLRESERHQ